MLESALVDPGDHFAAAAQARGRAQSATGCLPPEPAAAMLHPAASGMDQLLGRLSADCIAPAALPGHTLAHILWLAPESCIASLQLNILGSYR